MRFGKLVFLIILVSFVSTLFIVTESSAIPSFARRHKVSCTTCHAPIPKLKDYGDEFAGNGFIMKEDEKVRDYISAGDDLLWLNKTFPIGVRFDAYAIYDEDKPVNNLLKDFMKESFIFRRHYQTPSHLIADRVVHINEIFRITRMKRKQLILKYYGHFRSLNRLFRRYATLGFFSDHFIVMSLEDFDKECFTLKEIRYMHVGQYNLKFNFPAVDLMIDHGFGAIQPNLEENLYVIKGLVTKNPHLFNELKRKEQVTHTKSLVEGDAFWLIFDPIKMTWKI